jgi:hypothetical protein
MLQNAIIERLDQDISVIAGLVGCIEANQSRWKPTFEKWSILEVINHLADEEVENFKTRLDLTLHHPTQEWPAITPDTWAEDGAYNIRHHSESTERFVLARKAS